MVRNALLVSIVCCLLGGAAQAQYNARPHLVVRSGALINMYKVSAINPDCSSLGPATINLVEAPQGGQAMVREMPDYLAFPPNNPRSACNHRRVMATELFYRSAPGFVGQDRFSAEIIDGVGVARIRHFSVEVR